MLLVEGYGKYAELTEEVKNRTGAQGVVLIVYHGNEGDGYSINCDMLRSLFVAEDLKAIAEAFIQARLQATDGHTH